MSSAASNTSNSTSNSTNSTPKSTKKTTGVSETLNNMELDSSDNEVDIDQIEVGFFCFQSEKIKIIFRKLLRNSLSVKRI